MRNPGKRFHLIADQLTRVLGDVRKMRLPVTDRNRMLLAVCLALLIHGLVFILIPPPEAPPLQPFDAPMYVSFEPLTDDPEVDMVPESPPDPPPISEPEPEPPPAPTPDLLGGDVEVAPAPEPAPAPATAPTESPPAPERIATPSPPQRAPQPAPRPAPPPPERAPEPAPAPAPEPEPAPAPEPTPVPEPAPPPPPESTPVPEPPPPPPPPPPPREAPQRAFDPDALRRSTTTAAADTRLEQDLQVLYDWQQQYQQELAAYEAEQQERLAAADAAAPQPDVSSPENFLADQLARILTAIRASDRNVITVVDGREPAATDEPGEPGGDGSGIVIDTAGGTRRRIRGSSPDLSGLALPAGFPAEYPVRVRFSVNARGEVISAGASPPTPSEELNARIRTAVQGWQFEPAPGSSPVEGSVTIIVETSTRR